MNIRDKKWLSYALLVLAILIAGYLGVRYPLPEMPDDFEHLAVAPTHFRAIQVDHEANVDGDITGTLTGNVTGNVTGAVDVTTFLELSEGATQVVTADSVIVPLASMQPITSTTAVTCSATACITTTGFSAGAVLILRNDNAANIITIDGTGGTVECKANVALGAKDILSLLFNGTKWNCLSYYDNS